MAAERLKSLEAHLSGGSSATSRLMQKREDDVVITYASRTPLCKAHKGGFKDTLLDDIIFKFLQSVVRDIGIDSDLVEDICMGNVSESNAGYHIRAASLAAGFPNTTATHTINRFCSSGLMAVQDIAAQIQAGVIEIGLAMGVESMTVGGDLLKQPFSPSILQRGGDAADCMQPMGQTSENVASDFGVSRQAQDEYAAESYRRAKVAQESGWFDDEITPVSTVKDGQQVTLAQDECIRPTSYEALSKLRSAFPKYGNRSTAGNSSQMSDGAAAVLLMKRSKAKRLGRPVLAKFWGSSVAGLPPRIMGIGPTVAIPKLLKRAGISVNDVDVVEINEAFASMAVFCRDELKVDWRKLNPRGGAIALGHPLACTGVRQIVTGLSECRRAGGRILLTSMCIGTGQGAAGLFLSESHGVSQ